MTTASPPPVFTRYEKLVVAMLTFLQFTIILDFMILSPLGAFVMPALEITPQQFGIVVSAYAFAAGVSNFLAAGFADRFDRKRMLLFFYTGFMLGTLACGLAQNFETLLAARIVAGIFGGVIGGVVMAIATDLFPPEKRGRVMGLLGTAFAASQVLGLPLGLYFNNLMDWHAPFLMIVAIGVIAGVTIALAMRPVDKHLEYTTEGSAFAHLLATITEPKHFLAFGALTLLATGGFMLMPFGAAFTINNLAVDETDLPLIYFVTGLFMIFMGPLAGRAADKYGKYPVFLTGTVITVATVLYYTRLGATPVAAVIVINVVLFSGIFMRIASSQALIMSVPDPAKRGAFSAVSGSLQQLSGAICAALAGAIVVQSSDGHLERYPVIGYVVTIAALITLYFMWRINRQVLRR
ncbi:MAG: MFS transporter [Rhodospirillaceae bacterium]